MQKKIMELFSKDNLVAYYTMDSDNGAGTTLTDDEGNNDGSFKAHLPGVVMFQVLSQHYHLLIPQIIKQMFLSIQI